MRVGYLTNQYPAQSHTFIRREILALEAEGLQVERYTIRTSSSPLVESVDLMELERTHNIVAAGAIRLALATCVAMLTHPLLFASALRLALSMGRRSSRGQLVHLAYLVEACLFAKMTRRDGVRHVHAHFGTNSTAVAMLSHRLGGPTYSFTVHGPDEFDRPEELALGRKTAEASFVAVISEFGRSQLYRWCALEDWKKVHIVPCGVDHRFKSDPPTPIPSDKRLVWIGRIASAKGLPILLEACRRLAEKDREFEVVLAGDGPLREEIERRIAELGLAKQVILVGWVGDSAIRDLIESSRAIVLPSFAEGLPVVIMEALARGRPAIATRIAAIPELVVHGETGWLVTPGSVDELVAAIDEVLCTSPEELRTMGLSGRARVLEHHDVQQSARKLSRLFPDNGVH